MLNRGSPSIDAGTGELLRWIGGGAWGARARRGVGIVVTVAAAVSFALFVPAARFAAIEGLRQARYDLWVNGPIDLELADELARVPGVTGSARVADITPHYLELRAQRAVVADGRFFDAAGDIELVVPSSLRLSGAPAAELAEDEILMDRQTQEALGARLGDRVDLDFVDPEGNHRRLTVRLAGTYESSGHLASSVAGLISPELIELTAHGGAPYSSVYLTTERPADVRRAIEARFGAVVQVFDRRDQVREAEARANSTADVGRGLFVTSLAALVVAAIVYRDLLATLDLRQQRIAVLVALGVPPSRLMRAILIEQLLLLAVVVGLGVALGFVVFGLGTRLPIPWTESLGLAAVLALVAVVSTIVAIAAARYRLGRLPIVRLLFEPPL
jgi:hypothetical protein